MAASSRSACASRRSSSRGDVESLTITDPVVQVQIGEIA
jgi:hypothetical protein